jgi:hypothetical protein
VVADDRFAGGAQRPIACEMLEHQSLHDLERHEEAGTHDARRQAYGGCVQKHSPENPEL